MNPLILTLAGLSLLALLALILAATALCQARTVARKAARELKARDSDHEAAVQSLRGEIESLSDRVAESPPAQSGMAGLPRGGLNLAKRSQALRLNRHGNSPAQIATTLDIPRQEVELLLKVDRIVLSNL